jgi:hypothetical protein
MTESTDTFELLKSRDSASLTIRASGLTQDPSTRVAFVLGALDRRAADGPVGNQVVISRGQFHEMLDILQRNGCVTAAGNFISDEPGVYVDLAAEGLAAFCSLGLGPTTLRTVEEIETVLPREDRGPLRSLIRAIEKIVER